MEEMCGISRTWLLEELDEGETHSFPETINPSLQTHISKFQSHSAFEGHKVLLLHIPNGVLEVVAKWEVVTVSAAAEVNGTLEVVTESDGEVVASCSFAVVIEGGVLVVASEDCVVKGVESVVMEEGAWVVICWFPVVIEGAWVVIAGEEWEVIPVVIDDGAWEVIPVVIGGDWVVIRERVVIPVETEWLVIPVVIAGAWDVIPVVREGEWVVIAPPVVIAVRGWIFPVWILT